MIDTSYVQALQEQNEIQRVYEESVNEINAITNPITIATMRREQEMELGIFTESGDDLYMESVKTAVTALGDKIIELLQRLKDFITGIPDKIKNASWNKADVDKKMDMIKKDDPKRYEAMKVYVDKGMLDFNTFKSMKDFYAGFDDLMDELEKKDADEKTLRGKFEKFKKSLVKNKDAIATTAAVLGIVATGTTIALNYKKFRNESDRALSNEASRQADQANRMYARMNKASKILAKDDVKGNMKMTILANTELEVERQLNANVSKISTLKANLYTKFDKLASKFMKDPDAVRSKNMNSIKESTRKERDRLYDVRSNNRSIHINNMAYQSDLAKKHDMTM